MVEECVVDVRGEGEWSWLPGNRVHLHATRPPGSQVISL